jgi:SAM-dependent methyltransferase
VDELAPDGSPVEFYRRLPDLGEMALIGPHLPDRAAILELGCGAGRMTAGLLDLGHPVTAIDESEAMIAAAQERAPGATYLTARIEELELGARFPVVLLASHLINQPLARASLLACAARHLAHGGRLVGETYPPGLNWPGRVGEVTEAGPVRIVLTRAQVVHDRLEATVRYEIGGRSWEQRFVAELLDEPALRRCLEQAGLAFERWIAPERGWFSARTPWRRLGDGFDRDEGADASVEGRVRGGASRIYRCLDNSGAHL